MYEQNTSMMNTPERNTFLLPAMVEGDFSSDEIAEDADGLQMMSFQRVKIPAGGALQFEIPTEDPDYRTAMQMLFAGLVSAPPEDHANG